MSEYLLASLPGDGIGPEVTAEAHKICHKAALVFGFDIKWKDLPFGAKYYLEHNVVLPPSALDDMAECHAMLLGAVGDPRVKPGPLEQGLLLALRFHFDQYLNLRPALSFPNVPTPVKLADGERFDVAVVRENTEDFYMGIGGRGHGHLRNEIKASRGLYDLSGNLDLCFNPEVEGAFSLGMMTRPAITRITRKAGDLARKRGDKVIHIASKANAVPHLYGFWDEVSREVLVEEYPDLTPSFVNVDAMCYLLPRKPQGWGVLLCPNLFGDIISDLLSALAGGLGLAASGNIGDGLSMFEPVHGSAPDIAGSGKANPLAAIMSAAMMLEHVGQQQAAKAVEKAVWEYLAGPDKPIELGGHDKCPEVGNKVANLIHS